MSSGREELFADVACGTSSRFPGPESRVSLARSLAGVAELPGAARLAGRKRRRGCRGLHLRHVGLCQGIHPGEEGRKGWLGEAKWGEKGAGDGFASGFGVRRASVLGAKGNQPEKSMRAPEWMAEARMRGRGMDGAGDGWLRCFLEASR